jgi:hypothetical protein
MVESMTDVRGHIQTTINLQPDPRVLIAITHNPMRPLDALCELIDNAFDSFTDATNSGNPIESPTIQIFLPKGADADRGQGAISVLDNGPGLTLAQAQDALRAGFTSNNPFDRLGLFGMGFNISTGKLGRRTLFRTGRREETEMVEITVDLESMVRTRTYDVPVQTLSKNPPNFHGTLVQVSDWWQRGNQNHGFAAKLVKLGVGAIKEELGRRYSSILRERAIRVFVNDERVEAVEQCAWSQQRSVNHRELGRVPAVIRFDQVLATQVRCMNCNAVVEGGVCPKCEKSASLRTIEERVHGWVGIQRFDDANDYGVDLIRNGRAIRKSEKEAFFSWTDSRGRQIKDYPIDSPYGRIVGEVHLDFIPTDFLKQDFQRTSAEWIRAVAFLRGESSLQPRIAADAGEPPNSSPIYKLYQGYRRVRDFGTRDMYMGYWEPGEDRPSRISRDKEREYYARFRGKEPGFYDDTEWWKLVEQADKKPLDHLKECPDCAFQSLDSAEICTGCGHIFIGKKCILQECKAEMALSAVACPTCGASQEPKQQERWRCAFCQRWNPPTAAMCIGCGRRAGEVNPLSLDFLSQHANKSDALSIEGFSIPLPDGGTCPQLNIDVYLLETGITLEREGVAVPAVTFKDSGLKMFLDASHPYFTEYQEHLESIVTLETAKFVQDSNARMIAGDRGHLWSLPALCWQIARHYWKERLSVDPERTRKRAEAFLEQLRESLPHLLADKADAIYESMPPDQQGQLLHAIVQNGYDAREMPGLVSTGRYLAFLDNRSVANLVERYAGNFFDGKFWADAFNELPAVDSASAAQVRALILSRYRNFLEDILGFLEFRHKDSGYTVRADQTLRLLQRRIVVS